MKLWQRGNEIDMRRADAWIMRVAHNACIDFCRRRSRKRENPLTADAVEAVAGGCGPDAAWR